MGALSTILRSIEGGKVAFWCPGCDEAHMVRVAPPASELWGWNGNAERPTFTPSILVQSGHYASHHKPGDSCWCTYDAEHPGEPSGFKCAACHSFVTDGRIRFLSDCTHALAGQTVDLPPWGLPAGA